MNKYKEYKKVDLPYLKEIPEHWDVKKNKRILSLKKTKVNDNWNKYQLLSLTKMGVKKKDISNLTGKAPESFDSYQEINKGNLIMCLYDLDCSAVFSGVSSYDGMISSSYLSYNISDNCNKKFIDYWFKYIFIDRKYKIYSKSIRYTINDERFENIQIVIPPLKEQKQIAKYLDWKINKIDKLIEVEKEKIKRIEDYYKLILNTLYNNIEENIERKIRLRNFASLQNGISENSDFFESGTPFVSYSDVFNNDFLPSEIKGKAKSNNSQQDSFSVKKGDIFITRTSETILDAGQTSLCTKNIDKAVFSGFLIRIRQEEKIMDNYFLYYYTCTDTIRNQILKNLNLVTRVSISQNLLKNLYFKVPNLKQQEITVKKIEKIKKFKLENIKTISTKIQHLQDLKQSLISEVVTGKIDVRNVNIPNISK